MSKSELQIILPSEGDGWEVWSVAKGGTKLVNSIDGALTKSSGQPGDCVAFSACRVATLPLIVPSSDEEVYRGAAQLELENAGLLHDVENYKGWDCLPVTISKESAFVSAVYLLEEELNTENDLRHYSFDYSARFLQPKSQGDCVAMWRERNEWCIAFYRNNVPFLIEPLGNDLSQLSMNLNLMLTQLEVKGILFHPATVKLWSESAGEQAIGQQVSAVGLKLEVEPRPNPAMPVGSIELHPSAASEWQKRVNAMMRLRVISVAVAAIYCIVAVTLWWKMNEKDQRIVELKDEVESYQPAWQSNSEHLDAWSELEPLVTDKWPLQLYKQCVMSMPNSSRLQNIRLTSIDVQSGFIQMKGNAVSVQACNQLKPKLRKAEIFEDLVWEMRPEVRDPKTTRWSFQYDAKPEGTF